MAEEKRRYKATIAGKHYTLIGPGSTQEFDAVTKMLNEQLDQINRLQPDISTEDAAILLAFNALADQVKASAQQIVDQQEA
ncbi:cell division protein ZapA [Lacticaseibacillus songhuajiangensis]|jgi:cell division protein ZapA|uniref:cell division protein ZapA n=1 Tax=Lacticaseibacillus songhuajiangensis TaxID=1296539 RepID=UPI000F79C6AB|nr:cell division protein ZapA [Lacticaseibacillus songhuajiangensis]MCI1283335.1 cell division protein ZapA [Lacticaseibacillus songhuajiangensis]